MGIAKFSAIAVALLIGTGSGTALAQQDGKQPKTLMEERQGAIGGGQAAQPPKPAEQNKGLSGSTSGDNKAEEAARAATGAGSSGGSLQFGSPDKSPEGGLPAQRQGTIGNEDRPPQPTTQGGKQ